MAEREIGADYWRKYAEEARRFAEDFTTEDARDFMLSIAESYDRLAEKAEKEETKTLSVSPSPASASQSS